ncbi:phage tail assembly chaperone G, partial [Bacillus atrophaeus]
MEPISINLRINGKNKKFVTPNFISGKLFRDAAEITEDIESTDPERI